MTKRLPGVLLAALLCACSKPPAAPQQIPLAQLPSVDPQAVLAHTRVLSSDEYEGRGPGTKGEELTVRYLVDQLTLLGLCLLYTSDAADA